jgi:hypothetical protein
MRRRNLAASLAVILTLASVPIAADSTTIAGTIAGLELCAQSTCGAALFAGEFAGQVNGRPRRGAFIGAITHQDLPQGGGTSFITGGTWLIWTPQRTYSGVVLPGGMLTDTGGNTFAVAMTMVITRGGDGILTFSGILDHNPLLSGKPPTISGTIH